ncbi:hypothetical protein [Rhodococcus sp. 06-235-1A]|uniref:hypothetical protein n=1 Tax=Rhodococcus sp. 06-235-1A TaxID=2022508 RepID=UPI00117B2AA8|nr:hypothetical protein [Rhodococcus sp. 06-235-1A]
MPAAMRYNVIRRKHAITRKALRYYNIKTAATLAAVLTLGSGVLTPAVAQWCKETVEHADPDNPASAVLAFTVSLGFAIFTLASLAARLATIVIIVTALVAAVVGYAYNRFAKATSRWPYDIPPLGVETLRTRHGNDIPIDYDPHTGTSTAYHPNGQILQQIQHDTDKNHPHPY